MPRVQVNEQDVLATLRDMAKAINTMLERGEVVTTERTTSLPASGATTLPLRYNATDSKLEVYDPSAGAWKGVAVS